MNKLFGDSNNDKLVYRDSNDIDEKQSIALKKDGTVVAWGQTVIPDWSG